MSGDHTPLDNGDPGNPRKVERSVALPYAAESVTEARRGLCADLRALEVGDERIGDAALILSELVSNALRHAGPLPDDTVGVAWRIEMDDEAGGRLEIAVRDGGSSSMPRVARPSISGLGGRGLSIVQTLAGRWGTEMEPTTTTVWALVDLAVDGPPVADEAADLGMSFPSTGQEGAVEFGLAPREPVRGLLL